MFSSASKQSVLKTCYLKLASFILHRFDYYIGLTEQMSTVVNPFGKPFLVMEGLVDAEIVNKINNTELKKVKIYCSMLAGFIKIWSENLIEAFIGLKDVDVELHIYGSGDLENEMPKYCMLDKRVRYFGVVSNSIVVERLEEAMILINPRPTKEEFTKFSFLLKIWNIWRQVFRY